jgi:hypothetical protein
VIAPAITSGEKSGWRRSIDGKVEGESCAYRFCTLALTLRLDRLDWWSQMGRALVLFTLGALLVKGLYTGTASARVWLAASASVPHVQFSSHSGSTTQTTKGDRNE